MPSYMVTLKDGSSPSELETAKKSIESKGGKITKTFTLIKGFAVEVPADHISTLESNAHVDVEEDKEVKTQ